jgi:hypothetical protein
MSAAVVTRLAACFPTRGFGGFGGGDLLPTGSGEAHRVAGVHSVSGFDGDRPAGHEQV